MNEFEKRALDSYFGASPKTDLLISLSRLNVLRAAYDNVMALGMTAEWLCQDNSISIFSIQGPQFLRTGFPQPYVRQIYNDPHHIIHGLISFHFLSFVTTLFEPEIILTMMNCVMTLRRFGTPEVVMLGYSSGHYRLVRRIGRSRRTLLGSGGSFWKAVPIFSIQRINGGNEEVRSHWFGRESLVYIDRKLVYEQCMV
jgi:hypothetical protein